MRADDGCFYVVKFQNNPQHVRVLANELLASRLAAEIGLPVPPGRIVAVSDWLVANTPELTVRLGGMAHPCHPGLQFGSRYVVDPSVESAHVFDFLPEAMVGRVKNLAVFAGVLAFDKWTGNTDGRQTILHKLARERKYTVTFIDHGFCFNAGDWTFPDLPTRGTYGRNYVYSGVTGWESFEPWLGRIETMEAAVLYAVADAIPQEWYGDRDDLECLLKELWLRRLRVRELIEDFRHSLREPFPNWGKAKATQSQLAGG